MKDFNKNKDIFVRKADKSNVFVVLDREYYTNAINNILSDETKFQRIDKDPTESLKKRLNGLITQINISNNTTKMSKLVSHFEPGYIYANPKIHKRMNNPPFRPIISQIGTVTYELSKLINKIIVPYMPKAFQAE